MVRGYLVYEEPGAGELRVPIRESVVIGRTAECDIAISDPSASRRHLRVSARKGAFYWQDLGSTNGTLVNGRHMLEGELHADDVLEIGQTQFRLVIEEVADEAPQAGGAPLFLETVLDGRPDEAVATRPCLGKAAELLGALYSVINVLASNDDPCHLVDTVLNAVAKAVNAQRGALLFASPSSQDLQPCPVCHQVHLIDQGEIRHAKPGEIRISQTVARRVVQGGESVLFQDTDRDCDLASAQSILSLQLRSILCAPLRGKSEVLGVLYLDADRTRPPYSHDDLLLASAVGNSAGLAIENVRMHRQLLDKQRMDQEIEYARTIQEGFLAHQWPDDTAFEVYGETRPAKTIGGDFYDFIRPHPGQVGLLIGDVSGKGVPAALTMAQLLAEFRLHARTLESPAAVLQALNDDLVIRSRRGAFCTLCYLTIALDTGRVVCANAGHHAPLHISEVKARLTGDASGPPLGILRESSWTDVEWTLAPGDAVLLYTDGIVEARSMRTQYVQEPVDLRNEYGVDSLARLTVEQAKLGPRVLIEAINRDVRRHCDPAPPHDDCTLIALRYWGGGS